MNRSRATWIKVTTALVLASSILPGCLMLWSAESSQRTQLKPEEVLAIVLDGGDSLRTKGAQPTPVPLPVRARIERPYREFPFRKILGRGDQHFMRRQLDHPLFIWDISVPGSVEPSDAMHYDISPPLISKDGRVILLSIERFERSMPQRGWNILLIQENGTWTKRRAGGWVY